MATIRNLPSGRWNAIIRKKGLPTLTQTFETKNLAEEWVASIEKRSGANLQTISWLSTCYLSEVMVVAGKKRGGYRTAAYLLRTLGSHFQQDVKQISHLDIEAYKNLRLLTCKSGSVRLELQALCRVLSWCELHDYLDVGRTIEIFRFVKLPRASPSRTRVITQDELERLVAVVRPMMKHIFIIGYETAMRRSEILQITPSMISLDRRIIKLGAEGTKNGEAREVPLSTKATELLKSLCDEAGMDSKSLLFPCKPNSVTQAFKRAVVKVGLNDELCFHSLRHSCITRYAEKGLNPIQLQSISGHKCITMLSHYSHVRAQVIVKLME